MARRKRAFMDDGDSDSSPDSDDGVDQHEHEQDPDERDERELLQNPYGRKHKRMKRDGREDAVYGVFADDSEEDEGFSKRTTRGGARKEKRSDWAKAPAFVSSSTKAPPKADNENGDEDGAEKVSGSGEGDSESSEEALEADVDMDEPTKPPSPRVREADDDEDDAELEQRPRFGLRRTAGRGGLGLGAAAAATSTSKSPASSMSFSGFTKAAPGSSTHPSAIEPTPAPPTTTSSLPSAFGGAPRVQRAFVRDGNGIKPTTNGHSTSRSSTPLPSNVAGSFGARMLSKMGWQAGQGLGTSGEGIVNPVESKLRPKNMGIAFKGFTERTKQSKEEARRRGEAVSSDDEDAGGRKGKKGGKKGAKVTKEGKEEKREDAWKRPKKVKTRIEHKTYEQIVSEAGEEPGLSGIGIIIDATGATPREVSSIAEVSTASWTPSTDPTRLPEVRYNLRAIVDHSVSEIDRLAREARKGRIRQQAIREEDARLKKRVTEEAELIARLQQVHLVVDDIKVQAKELAMMDGATLEPFAPHFEKLLSQFPQEFDRYRLDSIVVAAIAPVVRRILSHWQPLQEPTLLLSTFRSWRKALRISTPTDSKPPSSQIDVYGTRTTAITTTTVQNAEAVMTPFESLLWTVWLPHVRSALNNEWDARDPAPAVKLYESWAEILPAFVKDNILDQLVLPKVKRAVADWSPRKKNNSKAPGVGVEKGTGEEVTLRTLVFPWLGHVGLRMDDVVDDAKRKLKSMLRHWRPGEPIPSDLNDWRMLLGAAAWDGLVVSYVLPKLGAELRDGFVVNPRKQEMEPLERVLEWGVSPSSSAKEGPLVRESMMGQLLEREFWPKWLDVLHLWLVQGGVRLGEVADWFEWWRGWMDSALAGPGRGEKKGKMMEAVEEGFRKGLKMMDEAYRLGDEGRANLTKPDHHRSSTTAASAAAQQQAVAAAAKKKVRAGSQQPEVTFKSIVEDYAVKHNLMVIPTGRAHEISRMPLYRVSATADGKGGLVVYVFDDAVYAPDPSASGTGTGGEFRAVSLENMVLRAMKGGVGVGTG